MIALFIIAFTLTIIYLIRLNTGCHPNFPPGPPRLPIWGSYWFLLKEDFHFAYKAVHKLAKKYNTDLLGFYLGQNPCVFATSHEMVKEVLNKKEFTARPDGFIFRKRCFEDRLGIFFVEGSFWKEQRRFSLRHLRDYGFGRRFQATEDIFRNEVEEVLNICDDRENKYSINSQIAMPDIFYAPTLNTMLYMLVGKKFKPQKLEDLTASIMRFFNSFDATGGAIAITPWLKRFAPNYFGVKEICGEHRHLVDFFLEEVQERKSCFTETSESDFLDTYLRKINSENSNDFIGSSFTENQLIWVLIDYMFPVPSSIPFVLSHVCIYLMKYPHILKKLQAEIDNVVGRNRPPNLNDRLQMPYTEAVIRETLRRHPALVITAPRFSTADTTINGYFIPKNTVVFPCQWSANHDPKIWDDPYAYKPERFLDEDGNLIKKDNTFAFGGGKRLCPGETYSRQLLFLFLTGVWQNFYFEPVGKIPDPEICRGKFIIHINKFWVKSVRR